MATSGVDGSYQVFGITTGTYSVRFTDPQRRFAPEWYDGVDSSAAATAVSVTLGQDSPGIDAQLRAPGVVTGVVTDTFGTPIEGVSVYGPGQSAKTDAQGRYQLVGFGVETPSIQFSKTGYVSQTVVVSTTPGSTTTSDVALPRRGVISGVVANANGEPVGGVRVNAQRVVPGGSSSATTDADGRYALTNLDSAQWYVSVTDYDGTYITEWFDGARTRDQATRVTTAVDVESRADFELDRGGFISGSVTDASGQPIPNVSVSYWSPSATEFYGASTDENGDYTIGGLETGRYAIEFNRWDYVTAFYDGADALTAATLVDVSRQNTATGIDAVLDLAAPVGPGSIAGTLSDSGGSPIAGAQAKAYQPGYQGRPVLRGSAFSDAQGVYTIVGLAEGTYFVQFDAVDHASEWFDDVLARDSATPIEVGQLAAVTSIDASLAAAAAFQGFVRDPQGGPRADVQVVLRSDLGDQRSTVTDSTGGYSFTDIDPGNYQFELIDLAGDFLTQYYPDGQYVAAAAGDSTDLDFTLDQPAAVVQGVVADEAGDPMPDQYVRLVTGSSLQSSSYRSARTDASGAYRFGRLDAGSYRVFFVGSSTLAEQWYENSSSFGGASLLDALAGVPQTVDFVVRERATVTGRVVNEAGAPLANIKIRARASNDSLRDVGLVYTDARGEFVLRPNVRDEIVLLVGPSGVYIEEYYPDASDVSAAQILDLSSTRACRWSRDRRFRQPPADCRAECECHRRLRPSDGDLRTQFRRLRLRSP